MVLESMNVSIDNNCSVSFYERFAENNTLHIIETTEKKETYLERALGFLIIDVAANLFVILILGISAIIRQKLVNTNNSSEFCRFINLNCFNWNGTPGWFRPAWSGGVTC